MRTGKQQSKFTENSSVQANMELFTPSKAYKPFRFPWAYEAWLAHEKSHWLHDEFDMSDKHHYLKKFNMDTPHNTALSMAVFGAFTEGLALFASFIMLLSFQRNNRMKSMCGIVDYSLRDENMHVQAVIKLYHELRNTTTAIDGGELDQDIYTACHEVVTNEDAFIDLVFEMGDVKGLTREGVKKYIRFIADRRLQQLGLEPIYGIEENPEPWIDDILSSPIMSNFFESRATEYTKAATTGTWSDVFSD